MFDSARQNFASSHVRPSGGERIRFAVISLHFFCLAIQYATLRVQRCAFGRLLLVACWAVRGPRSRDQEVLLPRVDSSLLFDRVSPLVRSESGG